MRHSVVRLRTATNGNVTTILETGAGFDFISNQWHQIALNYGPSSADLYVNGTLITNVNVGITQWPALADRANGLVIGNNHAGDRPINGQFGEVETFNRRLTAAEIERNFDSMHAYHGTNGVASGMAILKNQLGQGVSFHLRLPESDAGGFFLWQNRYTNGVTTVNPFTDSANAPVHFIH